MTTQRENSLGAKLRRAQDLLTYLNGFSNYNPPRPEESITELTNLVNSLVTANTSVDTQQETYRLAADDRQLAFWDSDGSIQKLLSPLRGAVEAQYGKSSKQTAIVAGIIRTMRTNKSMKSPADPNNETALSKSQQSFGSVAQQFSHLISALQTFGNYDPSNVNLKIATLEQKLQTISALSDVVAGSVQQLKVYRVNRTALYEDLSQRVQRVKSYVKSEYGNQSQEYKLIKGLSV